MIFPVRLQKDGLPPIQPGEMFDVPRIGKGFRVLLTVIRPGDVTVFVKPL